ARTAHRAMNTSSGVDTAMTTTERPIAIEPIRPEPPSDPVGVFARPVSTTGWRSWLFTVDHKRIGIMYGFVALSFFAIGGLEALLIRAQLAGPNGTILSADIYNQMFT